MREARGRLNEAHSGAHRTLLFLGGDAAAGVLVGAALWLRWRTAKERRDLEALLELAHDAIFTWDQDGRLLYWNRGAQEVYGWTADEALGRNVHDLLRTRFPVPVEEIEAEVSRAGHWSGEILHQATRTATRSWRTAAGTDSGSGFTGAPWIFAATSPPASRPRRWSGAAPSSCCAPPTSWAPRSLTRRYSPPSLSSRSRSGRLVRGRRGRGDHHPSGDHRASRSGAGCGRRRAASPIRRQAARAGDFARHHPHRTVGARGDHHARVDCAATVDEGTSRAGRKARALFLPRHSTDCPRQDHRRLDLCHGGNPGGPSPSRIFLLRPRARRTGWPWRSSENGRLFREVERARAATSARLAEETHRRQLAEETARFAEMFIGMLGHDLRNPLNAVMMSARLLQRRGSGDPKTIDRIRPARPVCRPWSTVHLTRTRLAGGLGVESGQVDVAALDRQVGDQVDVPIFVGIRGRAPSPRCATAPHHRRHTAGQHPRRGRPGAPR